MKSPPIKYSFVRIANCLICFWFNIMIIQESDVWHLKTFQALSSISHFKFRVYFSWDFLSDTWHQPQMFWRCLSSIMVVSRMGRPGGGTSWAVQIWWLSGRECPSVWVAHQTPTSVSSSRSGLCQYNIILNVIHISAFKLWLSAQWISKQNEFQTSPPFTADSSPRQCLQAPD